MQFAREPRPLDCARPLPQTTHQVNVIDRGPDLLGKLLQESLASLGLDIWESETPAVPIVLGSKERVYLFWRALLEKGVFTVMSVAPAVPAGKDLIRTAISATHSERVSSGSPKPAYAAKKI